jgi:molecular chaperone GrpE
MMPKEPEEKEETNNEKIDNETTENTPPEELTEATINPEEALAEEKQRAEEYLATLQRTQADFINYKRRVEQERLEFNNYANANLCNSILPVVDDLERALNPVPEEYAKTDWVEGVRLVEKKFKTILEGLGVKPICALGMEFDPNLHEAIRHEKGKEGMIITEHQKGYMLNDKLLRPSRVSVGKGEKEEHHKSHSKETKKDDIKEETEEKKEEQENG